MDAGTLQIESHEERGCLILRLVGDAGVTSAPMLESELKAASDRNPPLVVLDLSGLEFISSMSMGMLVAFQTRIVKGGGRCRVSGVRPAVGDALRRVHLDSVFDMHPTVEAAMAGFIKP
jgi:anti-sigma B factor antagonist